MRLDTASILTAMRADDVPAGNAGLWYVRKFRLSAEGAEKNLAATGKVVPSGRYTGLHRWTDASLHLSQGECVMVDHPAELRTHLNFVLAARGRVLVAGLGLGCVVRGLLLNPRVSSVDVVEREGDVLKLVGTFMPDDRRLRLHHGDVFEWVAEQDGASWDVGIYDLWTDKANGEPALAVQHASLLVVMRERVRRHCVWSFPRHHVRSFSEAGMAMVR